MWAYKCVNTNQNYKGEITMRKEYVEITMTKEEERVYNWMMKDERHHVVAVYGGVYHAIEEIMNDEKGMTKLLNVTINALRNNRFFKVEKDDKTVIRTICNLCYVDPQLLVVYAYHCGVNLPSVY